MHPVDIRQLCLKGLQASSPVVSQKLEPWTNILVSRDTAVVKAAMGIGFSLKEIFLNISAS